MLNVQLPENLWILKDLLREDGVCLTDEYRMENLEDLKILNNYLGIGSYGHPNKVLTMNIDTRTDIVSLEELKDIRPTKKKLNLKTELNVDMLGMSVDFIVKKNGTKNREIFTDVEIENYIKSVKRSKYQDPSFGSDSIKEEITDINISDLYRFVSVDDSTFKENLSPILRTFIKVFKKRLKIGCPHTSYSSQITNVQNMVPGEDTSCISILMFSNHTFFNTPGELSSMKNFPNRGTMKDGKCYICGIETPGSNNDAATPKEPGGDNIIKIYDEENYQFGEYDPEKRIFYIFNDISHGSYASFPKVLLFYRMLICFLKKIGVDMERLDKFQFGCDDERDKLLSQKFFSIFNNERTTLDSSLKTVMRDLESTMKTFHNLIEKEKDLKEKIDIYDKNNSEDKVKDEIRRIYKLESTYGFRFESIECNYRSLDIFIGNLVMNLDDEKYNTGRLKIKINNIETIEVTNTSGHKHPICKEKGYIDFDQNTVNMMKLSLESQYSTILSIVVQMIQNPDKKFWKDIKAGYQKV